MTSHRAWSLTAILFGGSLFAFVAWRIWFFSEMPRPLSELYLDVTPPGAIALSPDGASLAYVAVHGDDPYLFLRRLRDGRVTRFAGTENASVPFFSPDGRELGFVQSGTLRTIALDGGDRRDWGTVSDVTSALYRPDGAVVVGALTGLWTLSRPGQTPELLSPIPTSALGAVPDSEWVLLEVDSGGSQEPRMDAFSLASQEVHGLVAPGSHPRFASTGHLLYTSGGNLWAQRMDRGRAELAGRPVAVLSGVSWFDVGGNGTLVYRHASGPRPSYRVVAHWFEELKRLVPEGSGK